MKSARNLVPGGERIGSLLLGIWQEACRHLEISESLARWAPQLFARLPVEALLVRHIDVERRLIEPAGLAVCGSADVPTGEREELSDTDIERLVRWSQTGTVEHVTVRRLSSLPRGVLPPSILNHLTGEALVAPLLAGKHPIGIVAAIAQSPGVLQDRHARVLRMLLEPFTVWLENDRRVHELRALREAAEADNRSLRARLNRPDAAAPVIGVNTGLRDVMQRVDQVAPADVPVLILGETGSGKEVVARTIHERSRAAGGPFVRVNCGAIPPELIDSELFGHERGSFTGAVGERRGWFERADGGTLFLDECGELSPAAQVRLLRILQDGTFERVGGEKQVTVSVRVVAATHRDLEAMVASGEFRQDLWYRLAVFPIRLPALRERTQDIPAMAKHFAHRAAQRLGMQASEFTSDDLRQLVEYPWPGNVRELAAVIERAVILGEGKRIDVTTSLGPSPAFRTSSGPATPSFNVPAPEALPSAANTSIPTLDAAMQSHIEQALRQTHGRIEGPFGAAKLLAINPHTLRGRMRTLGIDWRQFRTDEAPAPQDGSNQ